MRVMDEPVRAVLFDLDGTLLDTAPDMVGALNELRLEHGRDPVPFEQARRYVSRGAPGMLSVGFADAPANELPDLRQRFLDCYQQRLTRETQPFAGTLELLGELEQRGIRWGVVTNKARFLAEPILMALGLHTRARVVVCGDTLPERKPSPMPLLHAAGVLQTSPDQCVYFGDDARDTEAALAAGMRSIVALFGYVPASEDPRSWPAHGWVESPLQLLELL